MKATPSESNPEPESSPQADVEINIDEATAAEPEATEEASAETEDNAAEASSPADLAGDLLARLDAAMAETDAWKDRYARSIADLENYRKRAQREKDELRKYAVGGFIEELLPVVDNLGLGLDAARQHHPEASGVIDGIAMIAGQLHSVLGNAGISVLDPMGEDFDPNFHDAVAHQPSDEVAEGKVMAVQRKGYKLHERILRPAAVVVSKGLEA